MDADFLSFVQLQVLVSAVHLAHPVTKIRLPPRTPYASSAKPGSRCEARAYSVIC